MGGLSGWEYKEYSGIQFWSDCILQTKCIGLLATESDPLSFDKSIRDQSYCFLCRCSCPESIHFNFLVGFFSLCPFDFDCLSNFNSAVICSWISTIPRKYPSLCAAFSLSLLCCLGLGPWVDGTSHLCYSTGISEYQSVECVRGCNCNSNILVTVFYFLCTHWFVVFHSHIRTHTKIQQCYIM